MTLPKNSAAPPSESVAQDQIRAFVDRILRLKEEAKSINGDIREVYAEAKGNGFDKTVLGKLVSYVEKRANGANDLQEAEALFDLYLSAYDGFGTPVATHTHEHSSRAKAAHAVSREEDAGERQHSSTSGKAGADEPGRQTSASADADPAPIHEPEAAMLPQTGGVTLVANSPDGASEKVGGFPVPAAPLSRGGTGGEEGDQTSQPVNVGGEPDATAGETATISDLTQPNPICRDPGDCGVYASWHHPCLACKRAANVRAAA